MQQLIQIVYRCNPKAGAVGQITWAPASPSDVTNSWQEWLRLCFQPVLLPYLISGFQTAQAQALRELCRTAAGLDAQLSPAERVRSLNAGAVLLFQKPPHGDRFQERFAAEVRLGRVPGHFATLFVLRAAGFSIPLRTALLAYLMQELFSGGCPAASVERSMGLAVPAVNAALVDNPIQAKGGMPRYG
jgi:hypothetical protein